MLLGKTELERVAASRPGSWTTEAERQTLIAADRARALLNRLSPSTDAIGCLRVDGPLDADARYLVLAALESEAAGVVDAATGKMVADVRIRYVGDRSGPTVGRGSIMIYLPGGSVPFLVVDWWVS